MEVKAFRSRAPASPISRINWASINRDLNGISNTLIIPSKHTLPLDLTSALKTPDLFTNLQLFLARSVRVKRNSEGLASFKLTSDGMKEDLCNEKITWDGTSNTSLVNKDTLQGILRVMRLSPRGGILPSGVVQSKESGKQVNTFVPLILAGFKKYQGVNYNDWDWAEPTEDKFKFLDRPFVDYSEYFYQEEIATRWTLDELTEFRRLAMLNGAKNIYKTPEATTSVSKQPDADFAALPTMLKQSMLQLWVACPHLYNPCMITNYLNLDAPPVGVFGNITDVLEKSTPLASNEGYDQDW